MKKKWTLIGVIVAVVALLGLWVDGRKNAPCTTCSQKEGPFFQILSSPTGDAKAREKKFLSFVQQSYPFFRVSIAQEEASYPDVQSMIKEFPDRFVKLPSASSSQELFYRWIHSVPSTDVIVLFPADEALSNSALERLKTLYLGSTAWLAFQGDINHRAHQGILTGYANLFQKIKLQDFLERGIFF